VLGGTGWVLAGDEERQVLVGNGHSAFSSSSQHCPSWGCKSWRGTGERYWRKVLGGASVLLVLLAGGAGVVTLTRHAVT
jgi:hypothetical protein